MGLEGEAPAGAGEDAGDGFLRIGAGAGLEEMPVGGEAGPAVHGCVVAGIDQSAQREHLVVVVVFGQAVVEDRR